MACHSVTRTRYRAFGPGIRDEPIEVVGERAVRHGRKAADLHEHGRQTDQWKEPGTHSPGRFRYRKLPPKSMPERVPRCSRLGMRRKIRFRIV